MRGRKRSEDAILNDKLGTLWSLVVRARAGNQCEVCGSGYLLQAHHMFGRGGSVKWELRTGVSLCRGCHFRFAHSTVSSLDWWDWVAKHRPEDRDTYRPLKNQSRKWSRDEKREHLVYLQGELARLNDLLEEAA